MSFERAGGVVIPFPQSGRARVQMHVAAAPISVSSSDALGYARRRQAVAIVRTALRGAAEAVVFGSMLAGAAVYAAGWLVAFGFF